MREGGSVDIHLGTRHRHVLERLRNRTLAVDGNGGLYQFLALIRLPDGTPLRDADGRVTSHLSGLFFRTTRLIADYGLRLVFVFDGTPPARKAATLDKRRSVTQGFQEEQAADGRVVVEATLESFCTSVATSGSGSCTPGCCQFPRRSIME